MDKALFKDFSIFEEEDLLPFKELESRTKAESSFYEFVKQAWHVIEGCEFSPGWHIEAICEHLECVFLGDIRNLLINVPPRSSKSTLVSCMFPAWVWLHTPEKQFLVASCEIGLGETHSMKCNSIIASDWFQRRWGDRFTILKNQNTKRKFQNDKHGYYLICTTSGRSIGKGGDYLIMDDPNPAEDQHSAKGREARLLWFSTKFSTRKNKMKDARMIAVMQRLHMSDCSGHILDNNEDRSWVHLMLPMWFSKARQCKTIVLPGTKTQWRDPRTEEKELIWPTHMPKENVDQLARTIRAKGGEYAVSGQLQQLPAPEDQGILKKAKFIWWKQDKPPDNIELIISSWDTALEAKDSSCYSAVTVWGIFKAPDGVYSAILLNMWRGRLEFPELQKLAVNIHNDYRNDGKIDIRADGKHEVGISLIEQKASGSPMIQSLRRAGINAVGFIPKGDKDERAQIASAFLDSGHIWVPAKPPYFRELRPMGHEFVELCSMFPVHEARDVVDTFSQAIIWLSRAGHLRNRLDPKYVEPLNVQARWK